MIGVLNKYRDVTDVRGDGGIVVDHGDGSLLGAHLQESLARHRTEGQLERSLLPSLRAPQADTRRQVLAWNLLFSPGSFPSESGCW